MKLAPPHLPHLPQKVHGIGPFNRDATGIDQPKKEKGIKGKVLRVAERKGWGWLGRALQVQRRYSELNGNNIAASVALQIFLSIFPLLLVAAAVVGFIVHDRGGDVTNRLIDGMGLSGRGADAMRDALAKASESRKAGSIIGLLTLAWSAIGVSSALQFAFNQAWQTGGRGVKDKAIGALWLLGAGVLFSATLVSSTAVRWLPAGGGIAGIVLGMVLTFALWMFTSRLLPNVTVEWRALIPGAVLAVIGLELLKIAGAVWVPRIAESSSSLYGTIGVVFAVLAWVLLFGKLVMYSAVLNVVLYEGKHGTTEQVIQIPKPAMDQGNGVTRAGTANT